jgi:hypothetical protein
VGRSGFVEDVLRADSKPVRRRRAVRRRASRTSVPASPDRWGAASGLANGQCATSRRLTQPWASRRVDEVGVMPRGEGIREAPLGWVSHWRSFLRLATDGGPFCVCWATFCRAPAAKRAPDIGTDCRVAWEATAKRFDRRAGASRRKEKSAVAPWATVLKAVCDDYNGLPIASFESPALRALIDRAFTPIPVAESRPRREPGPAPKPVGDAAPRTSCRRWGDGSRTGGAP